MAKALIVLLLSLQGALFDAPLTPHLPASSYADKSYHSPPYGGGVGGRAYYS